MFTTESIGNSTNLKCDYKKGDLVDEQSPYVGLCSLCWSIRTLPDNFTPRFINEKTCNYKDSDCLSKYGRCKQVYRSIDVLKNDASQEKPEWTQYTLNSPIGCECQVPQGSALIDFVKK
uniref:Uncharacterized protein n=1 Tax=Romanomermis culicivorax TaxID=13658 RepID=A0A915L3K4_ROMCU